MPACGGSTVFRVARDYDVEITNVAEKEAEAIYEWIAKEAPEAATRWFNELERRIEALASFPQRCPLAPESLAFDQDIRHLIYGRYRVLFTIRGRTVHILHVRHGARLPVAPDETERSDS